MVTCIRGRVLNNMKKKTLAFIFFAAAIMVYAQGTPRLPTIGILPIETSGAGVTAADASEVTKLIVAELNSWGSITVFEGGNAGNGEYLVKGQISRQNNQTILTAVTSETRSGRNLNSSKEQAPTLKEIDIESFCEQLTENIPYPNYLPGKWQSTINMVDGPVTCVMEFLPDRTIKIEQYDTWEHSGTNSLKYQAFGNGTYTYTGYRRRNITINNRVIQADATVGINLTLEDALPKYKSVSRTGIRLLYNEAKTSFELVNTGFPCGDNYTGTSVYPSAAVSYTRFTKIQ